MAWGDSMLVVFLGTITSGFNFVTTDIHFASLNQRILIHVLQCSESSISSKKR